MRKILDRDVVTADPAVFNGIIRLNETGALVWQGISEGKDPGEIVKDLLEEFDTTEEKASADVKTFVEELLKKGVFEEC